ncbi:MAG TPA: hypothetical protein VFM13_06325 [Gaiellaceae bacterium]|nr:hypothetical protein [Gaiellaceae bacterium]
MAAQLAVALAAASAVISVLLVPGARSASQTRGQIAFTRADGGIYAMRADGRGKHLLWRSGEVIPWEIAWSPNGRKLAVIAPGRRVTGSGLWVVNADGSGAVRLAGGMQAIRRPTWSPDGRRIAFTDFAADRRGIWVINATGGELRRLVDSPLPWVMDVDWSPVGNRITFAAGHSGWQAHVYVMNTDGSNLRDVTPGRSFDAYEPDWSPDGRRILFMRWKGDEGSSEIYVVNADGRSLRPLTYNGVSERSPAWSPDGRRIAFVRGALADHTAEIYVMNADGTHARRLTRNRVNEMSPTWQPRAQRR